MAEQEVEVECRRRDPRRRTVKGFSLLSFLHLRLFFWSFLRKGELQNPLQLLLLFFPPPVLFLLRSGRQLDGQLEVGVWAGGGVRTGGRGLAEIHEDAFGDVPEVERDRAQERVMATS